MLSKSIAEVYSVFQKLGYSRLTEVQRVAAPYIVDTDLDVLISSPTGTGKTEAALIPLLVWLSKRYFFNSMDVIYVTPLRALNRDIYVRIDRIAKIFGLDVDVWHGDTPYSRRRAIRRRPPNILITTPESFQIILVNNDLRKHLVNTKAIVIDEVQDLVTSERGSELIASLERLDNIAGRHVRRIGISGPIHHLDDVARYLFGSRRYIVVDAESSKSYDVKVVTPYEVGESTSLSMYMKGVPYIANSIKKLRKEGTQVLIFVNTRIMAEELGYLLKRFLGTYEDIAVHHGSLSREVREGVEYAFRSGGINVVVATSSLELGIDIGGVDLVIQYLSPRQSVKLLQRVGRAGHREERVSRGVVVVPPLLTEIFESLTIARRMMSRNLEKPVLHKQPLDVLAHQIVGMVLEKPGMDIYELYRTLSRSQPFSELTLSKLEEVVDFLASIGFVKKEDGRIYSTAKGRIYYVTTNMIVDTKHYNVRSLIDNTIVGSLDEEFVAICRPGDTIILGGRLWKIVALDEEKNEVLVEPIHSLAEAKLPRWVGETIPVSRNVMREVCSLIRRICDLWRIRNVEGIEKLLDVYRADETTKKFIVENLDKVCRVVPRDDVLTIEVYRGEGATYVCIYHCLGSKGSEAFSHLLIKFFKEYLGVSPPFRSHQMASVFALDTSYNVRDLAHTVARMLKSLAKLSEEEIVRIIVDEVKKSPLFRWRVMMVAKKLGLVKKDAGLSQLKRVVDGLMEVPIVVEEALRELMVEKLDVNAVKEFIKSLRDGRIRKIDIIITTKPSQYLLEVVSLAPFFVRTREEIVPQNVVIELVKRRLLKRRVKLFCMMCSKIWEINLEEEVSRAKDIFSYIPTCPSCSSRAVTVVDSDEELSILRKAVEKMRKGVVDPTKFLDEEKKVLEKAKKIASLVMDYGLAAIVALQGRGVGPETAKKILARSHDLNTLVVNVYEQEKTFLRTRVYWS